MNLAPVVLAAALAAGKEPVLVGIVATAGLLAHQAAAAARSAPGTAGTRSLT